MPAKVVDSRSSVATDPLRNFRFQININHSTSKGSMAARLGFMTCSGLNVETEVMAYRQGGYNTTTQKMPGQTNFSPLTLSRGMMVATPDSYEWLREIFAVIQGTGTGAPSKGHDFRATIDIYLLAHPYTKTTRVPIKAAWRVYNAWPASMAYSDLDAGGNAVMMEQMVLQHEGFAVSYASDAYSSDAPKIKP
jgi:phage tail-like protein